MEMSCNSGPVRVTFPPAPSFMHYSTCEYGKMPGNSIVTIFGSRSLAITVLCLGVDWVSLSIGLLSIVVVVVVVNRPP